MCFFVIEYYKYQKKKEDLCVTKNVGNVHWIILLMIFLLLISKIKYTIVYIRQRLLDGNT